MLEHSGYCLECGRCLERKNGVNLIMFMVLLLNTHITEHVVNLKTHTKSVRCLNLYKFQNKNMYVKM